jgi:RNA polymerase sigma factor (sigma-70 family)
MRFATTLVGPVDAADVVSDAVVRSIYGKSWPSVRNQRAYLYRAVLTHSRSHYRRTLRRRAREQRAASPEAVLPPELHPEVLEAMAKLSMRQRAVVFLTYWSDLQPGRIGEMLEIGEGSVRRHLARGRAKLRELLDE